MDAKYSAYVLFAVVGIWALPTFGGDYVTYKDPKTGAIYFGDGISSSAPKGVKVEVKRHEGVPVLDAYKPEPKVVRPTINTSPKEPQPSQGDLAIIQNNQRIMDQLKHQSNKPTPPSRDKTARDFNRAFDKQGQYEADMFEWRAQGRELRQQYNAPTGFGRNPTGFSQEEKRYYKSYAP